jgi:hypothetical protein
MYVPSFRLRVGIMAFFMIIQALSHLGGHPIDSRLGSNREAASNKRGHEVLRETGTLLHTHSCISNLCLHLISAHILQDNRDPNAQCDYRLTQEAVNQVRIKSTER